MITADRGPGLSFIITPIILSVAIVRIFVGAMPHLSHFVLKYISQMESCFSSFKKGFQEIVLSACIWKVHITKIKENKKLKTEERFRPVSRVPFRSRFSLAALAVLKLSLQEKITAANKDDVLTQTATVHSVLSGLVQPRVRAI